MDYFRANIEAASGYEPGFQPQGLDVVKLNTNENPYPPSPEVLKSLAGIEAEQLRRYPDPLGNRFRDAAAELNGVERENIICCNGGDDLLRIAVQCFCDEKRLLAYPVPTYSLYPVLGSLQNCKTIEVRFDKRFNLPGKLAATNATLTIVCNPNAPSGTIIPCDELAKLAGAIRGVLLIDEAYVDFAEDNCVSLAKRFSNVIILRSMSKGYSLAGLRFGYGIADKSLIAGLMKAKDSYNVNSVSVAAATVAIKDQGYFRKNIEKVVKQRRRLRQELEELGFEMLPSSTNFILVRHKQAEAVEIHKELMQKSIYVRYFDYPGLRDKLRITVGAKKQNDRLVASLVEILS